MSMFLYENLLFNTIVTELLRIKSDFTNKCVLLKRNYEYDYENGNTYEIYLKGCNVFKVQEAL